MYYCKKCNIYLKKNIYLINHNLKHNLKITNNKIIEPFKLYLDNNYDYKFKKNKKYRIFLDKRYNINIINNFKKYENLIFIDLRSKNINELTKNLTDDDIIFITVNKSNSIFYNLLKLFKKNRFVYFYESICNVWNIYVKLEQYIDVIFCQSFTLQKSIWVPGYHFQFSNFLNDKK